MSDILKRERAPITEKAWAEIDDTARRILRAQLACRAVADFKGPYGWELAALNLGRLDIPGGGARDGVHWGLRKVQPLVEVRIPFSLDQMELDSISRGLSDPDLAPLEEAARKAAAFEESAVFKGFEPGGIRGLLDAAEHAVELPAGTADYPSAVARGLELLRESGIEEPYVLVLGAAPYQRLIEGCSPGYPPLNTVRSLVDHIWWSPALDGGVLLSQRGGDFELTIGQDFSIGYCSHDRDQVELYITESFTFQVLEPAAAVVLRPGG